MRRDKLRGIRKSSYWKSMQFGALLYFRSSLHICEQILLNQSLEMHKEWGDQAWWDDFKLLELNLCWERGSELQCWDLSWHGEGFANINTWHGRRQPIIMNTNLIVWRFERSLRLLHQTADWEKSIKDIWWKKNYYSFGSKTKNTGHWVVWREYDIELETEWSLFLWDPVTKSSTNKA